MSPRLLAPITGRPHGRALLGDEPLVFHCNFYNYWLQKTLLLDESIDMTPVIVAAASESAAQLLRSAGAQQGLTEPADRARFASDTFSELGFGVLDLSKVGPDGGEARLPVSHYGLCLRQAVAEDFATPQTLFDAGYAAAAAAWVFDLPEGSFAAEVLACQSMGAPEGRIALRRVAPAPRFPGFVNRAHSDEAPPPPHGGGHIDEAAVLAALATLDFSGNEEGLLPRFGVMLTRHLAGFYNRSSFEFVRAMADSGLEDAAEVLLTDTAYRCAFHTLGGIMISPEWDAVVRPHCRDHADQVHGIIAVINALGWGTWRVVSVSDDELVVRVWDDYESCGWLDLYGPASRPVSFLAQGAAAGIMNLVHVGHIADKPELDLDFYARCFEADGLFTATQTRSFAMGDPFTEIVVRR